MQLESDRSFTHSKFASLDAGHTILYMHMYGIILYYMLIVSLWVRREFPLRHSGQARQTCKVSITVCTLDVHGPRLRRRLQLKPDRRALAPFFGFDSFNQAAFYFSFSFCACDRAIKWFSDRVRVWMQSSFARLKTNLGLLAAIARKVWAEFGQHKYVKEIFAIIWDRLRISWVSFVVYVGLLSLIVGALENITKAYSFMIYFNLISSTSIYSQY